MKMDIYIIVSNGLWDSESMLKDAAYTLHFIREFETNIEIKEAILNLESDYGELIFQGTFGGQVADRDIGYIIERDSKVYFNLELDELTVDEYVRYYCSDKVRMVFFKGMPNIGGDGPAVIDWVRTMYNLLNQFIVNNPAAWFAMGALATPIFKGIVDWVEFKIQKHQVTPELLLKAIYSRECWDPNDFNNYFELYNINASIEMLIIFGYKKEGRNYVLKKKLQPADFQLCYIGDYIVEIERMKNESGLG